MLYLSIYHTYAYKYYTSETLLYNIIYYYYYITTYKRVKNV